MKKSGCIGFEHASQMQRAFKAHWHHSVESEMKTSAGTIDDKKTSQAAFLSPIVPASSFQKG
jgi:hypothetical protein